MKFGRNRPIAVHPHLKLGNYLRATLPAAPATCDFTAKAAAVLADVYQNDALGDCVVAGGYHVAGVETGNAGSAFHATPAQIIADYSKIGGYVPGDPSTDNGADLQTALAYWSQTGFANGTKLLGYLSVDPTNKAEVQAACWLFENLYIALELPDTYVNPFPSGNGFVWDVGTPNPQQGHCIMAAGYGTTGITIGTWGMIGTLTYAALAALCSHSGGGELWIMLTPDQLAKGASKAPNGVDWAGIVADFDSLGGHVPVPAPPAPPPPAPVPGAPTATLAQAEAWLAAGINAGSPLLTKARAIAEANAALAAKWPKS